MLALTVLCMSYLQLCADTGMRTPCQPRRISQLRGQAGEHTHSNSHQTTDLSSSFTLLTINEDVGGGGGGGVGGAQMDTHQQRAVQNGIPACAEDEEDMSQQLSVGHPRDDVDGGDRTMSHEKKLEESHEEAPRGLVVPVRSGKMRSCSLRCPSYTSSG